MRCIILVAAKTNSIPIAECGGVVLADGDQLLIRYEIAERMLLQYRGYLVQAGEETREALRGGHYEYIYKGSKPQSMSEVKAPEVSPLVQVSADKSFIGKIVRRKKGM